MDPERKQITIDIATRLFEEARDLLLKF